MRSIFKAFSFLLMIVSAACGRINESKESVITIAIDECTLVDCDEFPSIFFSDDYIISMFDDILLDSKTLIIKSGNNLYGVDVSNGHFTTRFSYIGNGPKEYIQLWDFCVKDEDVLLYDIDKKNILRYSKEGRFVSETPLDSDASANPFQYIFPLDDSLFVGKRIYGMPDVPELSVYDSDFNYRRQVGEMKLKSGIRLWREFYPGSDRDVLFARYFSNDILSIRKDSVLCKYQVDFGRYSFDDNMYQDEYECIEQLNRHENRYASLISNLYEDEKTFAFQFVKQGDKYLTVFNRNDGCSKTLKFTSAEMHIEQVIFGKGNIAYVFFSDEESNGGYYVIHLNRIIK